MFNTPAIFSSLLGHINLNRSVIHLLVAHRPALGWTACQPANLPRFLSRLDDTLSEVKTLLGLRQLLYMQVASATGPTEES